MLVTILALALCLSTAALFPVDIFLVSKITDPSTGQRYEWATQEAIAAMQNSVKLIYFGAYGSIASFCFFWIPFAYFYFEEQADEEQTFLQRIWSALKYTFFFILVAGILLLTGWLMKPDRHEDIDLDWLRKMLADFDGIGALAFVAGILALAGTGILAFYTAPGLSLLPLHLMAGLKSNIPSKVSDAHAELAANRHRQNSILERYRRNDGQVQFSDRDREALGELAEEELRLESRSSKMERVRDSYFLRCQWIIRPFQIIFGVMGSILTVLLIASLAVTRQVVSKFADDVCGAPCGYIISSRNLPNPLNLLFLRLSPYFPVDYILIVMIILYLFWATTKGIISIGIRFLWVSLYTFRKGATQPQGLLVATMLLMLGLAGLTYSLTMSVAPEYSMFGSQRYCNYTTTLGSRDCSEHPSLIIPCHIDAPEEACVRTVTSDMILKIILVTPALGRDFLYMEWVFLAVFLLALLFNLIQGCRRGFGVDPVDEAEVDDLDESEIRGLLSQRLDSENNRRRMAGRRGLMSVGPRGRRQSPGYGATRSGDNGDGRN
ncbi:hypothetical protein BG011_003396 [Mortierella polycephala]|uniref:Probable lysosomal cobalamin transporter n=1 Tax=Mortierella polycephala TaxID=41804 RepID=A0A9P6U3P2_9FUNG|nr:hypothetical protein BG011_003396 [Mortierella polycephala]